MRDCKKYQSMIKDFDRGRLACSDEEEFVNHIEQCNDCKEEFEIYYIVEYGLNDDMDNIPIKKEYRELLEKYDFKGLIGAKIKDSRNNIEAVKKHNRNVVFCFWTSELFILLTLVSYIIIRFF